MVWFAVVRAVEAVAGNCGKKRAPQRPRARAIGRKMQRFAASADMASFPEEFVSRPAERRRGENCTNNHIILSGNGGSRRAGIRPTWLSTSRPARAPSYCMNRLKSASRCGHSAKWKWLGIRRKPRTRIGRRRCASLSRSTNGKRKSRMPPFPFSLPFVPVPKRPATLGDKNMAPPMPRRNRYWITLLASIGGGISRRFSNFSKYSRARSPSRCSSRPSPFVNSFESRSAHAMSRKSSHRLEYASV